MTERPTCRSCGVVHPRRTEADVRADVERLQDRLAEPVYFPGEVEAAERIAEERREARWDWFSVGRELPRYARP